MRRPPDLVHVRSFGVSPDPHGGVLRSDQVEYLVRTTSASAEVRSFYELPPSAKKVSDVPQLLRAARWQRRTGALRGIRWRGRTAAILRNALLTGAVVSFEAPSLAVRIPRAHRAKAVAIIQNVEGLTPRPQGYHLSQQLEMLRFEVSSLADFHAVFCISREDQWFLSSLGIDARYLPFHPAPERAQQLGAVQLTRDSTSDLGVLVVGSMSNPPSGQALERTVAALHAQNVCHLMPVTVVGTDFGDSERRRLMSLCPSLRLAGRVTTGELFRLFSVSRVAVVFQVATSGWPTRLVEMPMAGLPVIVNRGAIRAQAAPPSGVRLATYDDLGSAVLAAKSVEGTFARPPEEDDFRACLGQMISHAGESTPTTAQLRYDG